MANKNKPSFTLHSHANVMIKGSVEKMQRPLNEIRGKSLKDAMTYLMFCPYGSSRSLAKLLKSAASNSLTFQPESDLANLWISEIWAVKDMELRRMKAGPKGKGRPIRKRYSKIFVELGVKHGA
jgi:large subunit ribosomal protein L22